MLISGYKGTMPRKIIIITFMYSAAINILQIYTCTVVISGIMTHQRHKITTVYFYFISVFYVYKIY